MAFYYDGHEGYHTAVCFGFRCACLCALVSDKDCNDNNSVGARGDVSQRACTGSEATKWCAVTWLVEASGPHTLFCLHWCYFKDDSSIVSMNPDNSWTSGHLQWRTRRGLKRCIFCTFLPTVWFGESGGSECLRRSALCNSWGRICDSINAVGSWACCVGRTESNSSHCYWLSRWLPSRWLSGGR